MRQDLLAALRGLRQHPAFAVVAIGTLGLGIGGTVALFSVVYTLMLRPLPYAAGERLVAVWETGPRDIWARMGVAIPDYEDWRARRTSFDGLGAYMPTSFNLEHGGDAIRVEGQIVSSTLFPLLGLQPALGRGFSAEEDREGAARVILLSHGLWTRLFGTDSSVLGRPLRLNGGAFTIIGVMPKGFRPPTRDGRGDVFAPLGLLGGNLRIWRPTHPLIVLGRVRAGTALSTATREIDAVAREIWATETLWRGWRLTVVPLRDELFGDLRPAAMAVWGAAVLVLLVTCANLANLLLARGVARRRDLAVRLALGAGIARVTRGLLIESGLIALAGGVIGIVLAVLGVAGARGALAPTLPQLADVSVDGWVLGFAFVLAAATGLLFGSAPAVWAARVEPHETLREGARSAGGRQRTRVRDALVAAQVAMSFALVTSATLLMRSLDALREVDPGVRTEGTLTFRVTLPPGTYSDASARATAAERVRSGVVTLPGVVQVGYGSSIPFVEPGTNRGTSVFVEGRPRDERTEVLAADVRVVSDGYAEALGIRVLSGRDFSPNDDAVAPRVALVSATMAQRVWPGQDPIGAGIRTGDDHENVYTVVGIVSDVRNRGLRDAPVQEVYVPFRQRPGAAFSVVVKTNADPASLIPAVRAVVARVDPALPPYEMATMGDHLARTLAVPTLASYLSGGLAALAGLVAVLGLHGLVSYAVSLRTREFAVRMALGARSLDMIGLVLRGALLVVLSGIAVGVLLAIAGSGALGALLYGVGAVDVRSLAAVALGLGAVAMAASSIAAWRAGRVEPMAALRTDT
jgi:putative ABC transport system permease protein